MYLVIEGFVIYSNEVKKKVIIVDSKDYPGIYGVINIYHKALEKEFGDGRGWRRVLVTNRKFLDEEFRYRRDHIPPREFGFWTRTIGYLAHTEWK